MKILLIAIALAFSSMTFAGGPNIQGQLQGQKQKMAQSQLQGQLQGQKQSSNNHLHSYQKTNAKASASAAAIGVNSNTNTALSGAVNHGNSVNVEGDDYDLPSNTAATSFGSDCTDAGAVQQKSWGFSFGHANPVCEQLKMFDVYNSLGMEKEAKKALKRAGWHANNRSILSGIRNSVSVGFF